MKTIGDPTTFAFEICSEDLSAELVEVHLVIGGKRLSGQGPVYVPTFLGALASFLELHKSEWPKLELPSSTHEHVFQLFHNITETSQEIQGIKPAEVLGYHRLWNLDDLVDGWEIYVFDSDGEKHIACRAIRNPAVSEACAAQLICASLPRQAFLDTMAEIIALFSDHRKP